MATGHKKELAKLPSQAEFEALLLRELESLLDRNPIQYIVPANNLSGHVLRILFARSQRSNLPRIRNISSLVYLPSNDYSLGLFVAELEYGRTLFHAVQQLPQALVKKVVPLSLLVNNANYAVEDRRNGLKYYQERNECDIAYIHFFERALFDGSIGIKASSDDFHQAIGYIRSFMVSSLNQPFNRDATIIDLNLPSTTSLDDLVPVLADSGSLVSTLSNGRERFSLIDPTWFHLSGFTRLLKRGTTVKNSFHKIRLYPTDVDASIRIAPMVFMNLILDRKSEDFLSNTVDSTTLRSMMAEFQGVVRNDITEQQHMTALFDVIKLWADCLLARSFSLQLREQGIEANLIVNSQQLEERYGRAFGKTVLGTIEAANEDRTIENYFKSNGNRQSAPIDSTPGPATAALLKTITLNHYRNSNDSTIPRTCWKRAGLTLGQLKLATGLPRRILSMAIDMLSDAGLTESYNILSQLTDGRYEINRAYNSLAEDFIGTIALSLGRLEVLRQQQPRLEISTADWVLNKVLCFEYYFFGYAEVRVIANKHGKTMIAVMRGSEEKFSQLKAIILNNSKHFQINSKSKQITLTKEGREENWFLHLVDTERTEPIIKLVVDSWTRIAVLTLEARRRGDVPGRVRVPQVFATLLDCIGIKNEPEWGYGTIAHLVERGLRKEAEGKPYAGRKLLEAAEKKVKTLRMCSPIVFRYFKEVFDARLYETIQKKMVARLGVVPAWSPLLDLANVVISSAKVPEKQRLRGFRGNELTGFTNILKPESERFRGRKLPAAPRAEQEVFVAFVDLLGMKKLAELDVPWSLSGAVTHCYAWAIKFNAISFRSIIDGAIATFHDIEDAVKFCAGAGVHVESLYHDLGQVTGIETGLVMGIAHGTVDQFSYGWESEITGKAIARAVRASAVGRGINFQKAYVEKNIQVFEDLGIGELIEFEANVAVINATKAFRQLILLDRT